jgi:hypothetical protein
MPKPPVLKPPSEVHCVSDVIKKLTGDDFKVVYLDNKKYKEFTVIVSSYDYGNADDITKYLCDKKIDWEAISNYKGKYDYDYIFIHVPFEEQTGEQKSKCPILKTQN